MNSNKKIKEIPQGLILAITSLKNEKEVRDFFNDILTQSEIETLSKRWRIMNMLKQGSTQREIAQELQVSLCKVTRGAKILKTKNSVITKYLIKEKN